jgi:hypothetical protein
MLVNLLPGLREARGPLAVGALWLVDLILVLGDRFLPPAATPRVAEHLPEVVGFLGKGVAVAALGFTAYFVGSVVFLDPRTIRPGVSEPVRRALEAYIPVAVQVSVDAVDAAEPRTAEGERA